MPKPGNCLTIAGTEETLRSWGRFKTPVRLVFKVLRGMFGSGLSLQLEGAMESFVIVFAALILFLIVKARQGMLEEVQDSMSETERGKRLGAQRKKRYT